MGRHFAPKAPPLPRLAEPRHPCPRRSLHGRLLVLGFHPSAQPTPGKMPDPRGARGSPPPSTPAPRSCRGPTRHDDGGMQMPQESRSGSEGRPPAETSPRQATRPSGPVCPAVAHGACPSLCSAERQTLVSPARPPLCHAARSAGFRRPWVGVGEFFLYFYQIKESTDSTVACATLNKSSS